MENIIFQKFYSQLNPEQKEAVDTLEGPVMVVAGPGTGKTQVLTLRIANILLQEKAKPEEILALTFTESGVSAMRKRLIDILGPKAYYIPLYTFHAFCNEIIQNNPDEFPQFHDKNIIDEIGRMQIMEGVIQEGNFKLLKPYGDNLMYVGPLLHTFSDMKREGIGPEKLLEVVGEEARQFTAVEDLYHQIGAHKGKMKGKYKDWERNIQKNQEMAAVFAIYQEKLRDVGYDYDDIILSVVGHLERDKVLVQKLQEQYIYLLADEHQDTNQAQNKVLELLCVHQKNPNIFVVGDEKQSIYRFQGANLANFLYFHSSFPEAKIIILKENYRSSQKILDGAGSVIENNSQGASGVLPNIQTALAPLKAGRPGVAGGMPSAGRPLTGLEAKSGYRNKKIRVYALAGSDSENYFIARKIKKLLRDGVDAAEIAVLYRDNRDAFPIRDMLERHGVSSSIESDTQLLENEDIKNLFLLIKAVSRFGSDEYLAKVLHADFLKIPALDIYKLLRRRKGSLYDALGRGDVMRALGVSDVVRLNNLYKKLSSWNVLVHNKSTPQVFESIVRESGFFDHILAKNDYIEGVGRVRSLHSLLGRLASENSARGVSQPKADAPREYASGGKDYTLQDFVQHLELIQEWGVSLRERKLAIKRNAVRLMTAHRSKGLEFDYVFLAGVTMGHWGMRRTRQMLKPPTAVYFPGKIGKEDDPAERGQGRAELDDERRLFYVALTRARRQIYISYPSTREDGRELFPAQFIEEIHKDHKVQGNSEIYERGLERNPKIIFAKGKEIRVKEDEQEFLREVFQERGLSPTALSNYIECPWKYFYNNLLQIPRAKTKHEMYGTAVHAALKDLFDNGVNRTGAEGTKKADPVRLKGQSAVDYLLTRFEHALAREAISEHDFMESLAKGKETLAKYYENYAGQWHTNTMNEFGIKNVFLDGEVRLTGKIDKIELISTGTVPVDKGNQRGLSPRHCEVNVVDYKTGKRKTRNALEGKTKDARGNEKRQLVFYKLLLDKMPESLYTMISGEIDFVEPEKTTGKFYKEKFEITADDVRELEYKIQDVTAEILGFSFWDTKCENKDCEYCKLREMMK